MWRLKSTGKVVERRLGAKTVRVQASFNVGREPPLCRLLHSIRAKENSNRTIENEEGDAHSLPFLPAQRPRPLPLTPTASQRSPAPLGTLAQLAPELRLHILIAAFGSRTLHLNMQRQHPGGISGTYSRVPDEEGVSSDTLAPVIDGRIPGVKVAERNAVVVGNGPAAIGDGIVSAGLLVAEDGGAEFDDMDMNNSVEKADADGTGAVVVIIIEDGTPPVLKPTQTCKSGLRFSHVVPGFHAEKSASETPLCATMEAHVSAIDTIQKLPQLLAVPCIGRSGVGVPGTPT
ncbi:hypothetical protein VTI74DRAFT_10153 [Chaetomium olivicolor]